MAAAELLLPLFPLEQVVLFPGMPLRLHIFEERYKRLIGSCQRTGNRFGVLLIREGREVGEPARPERVGCTARLVKVEPLPDGRLIILTVGEHRFRLRARAWPAAEGYLVGQARVTLEEPSGQVAEQLVADVASEFRAYRAALARAVGSEGLASGGLPAEPAALSFLVAAGLDVHPRERQQLLEIDGVAARLERELALLRRENRAPSSVGPFSIN